MTVETSVGERRNNLSNQNARFSTQRHKPLKSKLELISLLSERT